VTIGGTAATVVTVECDDDYRDDPGGYGGTAASVLVTTPAGQIPPTRCIRIKRLSR
jgi:hypothetical protein